MIAAQRAAAYDLCLALDGGTGGASGSYADAVTERYEALGATSFADRGSARVAAPFLAGGAAELRFDLRPRLALTAGLEGGQWGLSLGGRDSTGTEFAATRLRCFALAVAAGCRSSLPLGPVSIEGALALLAGLVVSNFTIEESLSGVATTVELPPAAADRLFWGLAGEVGLAYPIGRGRMSLGLRGELGLSDIGSRAGALGDTLARPWRALARLGYSVPLGRGAR